MKSLLPYIIGLFKEKKIETNDGFYSENSLILPTRPNVSLPEEYTRLANGLI